MSVSSVSRPSFKQPAGAGPWEPPGGFGEDWWQKVKPLAHAMVYKVPEDAVLKEEVELPERYTLESWWLSSDQSTLALLASEDNELKWAPTLREMKYDLFVAHLNQEAVPHLLFLTSSRHGSDTLYRKLAEVVLITDSGASGSSLYRPLEIEELKRIFDGVDQFEFINLGMRPKHWPEEPPVTEAYRVIAGHDLRPAHDGETPIKAGHAVAVGEYKGNRTTLGFSRSSKVWGTDHVSLTELARWCDEMAEKLRNPNPALRPPPVDLLI